MFQKKRGISPLIATILLIAFVVVIALLVWFWYSDLLEEYRTKEGQQIQSEFTCASDVEISANLVDCTTNSISFNLKNKGSIELISFYIVGTDDLGNKNSITSEINLAPGATLKPGATLNTGAIFDEMVGNLEEVDIIPILSSISCTEKQITLSC